MDKDKNNNEVTKIGIDVKNIKTSTTVFLLPALELDKNKLLLNNFINAYCGDNEHEVKYENCLYLLFKNVDNENFEELIQHIEQKNKIIEVYDINGGYTVIVVKFPINYNNEFKNFKDGKFSKFSKSYINSFFPFKKPTEWDSKGKVKKEEYTLFYHIFNKTQWLKDWWAKRLGYEDMKEFELEEWWNVPHDKEEVLRYKNKNDE